MKWKKALSSFTARTHLNQTDYGRIINSKRFRHIGGLSSTGKVIAGGKVIKPELYMSPTIMEHIVSGSSIMKEEIFGPVLPVITYKKQQDALEVIRQNPNPLSLYYFGKNKENENAFIEEVQFGGGCINNTLVHLANADLPFGGVGNSGVGAYHGKFSFDTFTHAPKLF